MRAGRLVALRPELAADIEKLLAPLFRESRLRIEIS